MGKMRIKCERCCTRFVVDATHGGKWGICSMCRARMMLPIPDPEALFVWCRSTPYDKLVEFIQHSGARGHTEATISELIRICEIRRWNVEDRTRAELEQERAEKDAAELAKPKPRDSLESLRALDPYSFEQFVAELFNRQGFHALAVGGSADNGVDVLIRQNGELWGIAQCKRYSARTRVGAMQIRDFGGAFMLSKVPHGFFFTTGLLTRHARKTARGFPWLVVYDGPELVRYAARIQAAT